MLGRNELCPCGSGKKYKRCCLNKDVVVGRAGRKVGTAQKQYSELYTRIYEYSRQDKFKEEYEKAKEMFYIINDETINSKFDRFFNTYFIQDHIMENPNDFTIDDEDNSKIIDIQKLKTNGYINSIPISQTKNKQFTIKIVQITDGTEISEELRIICEGENLEDGSMENDTIFFPKP